MKFINSYYFANSTPNKKIIKYQIPTSFSFLCETENEYIFLLNNDSFIYQEEIKVILINFYNVIDSLSENQLKLFITNVVENAFKIAHNLSEKIDTTKERKDLVCDCIFRIITSFYMYKNDDTTDIFHLCSEIFFNLLTEHILSNGNKRMSICVLVSFLYVFGFYFKYTKGQSIDYQYCEDKIIYFVEKYSQFKNQEEIINEIHDWIIDNVLLGLNIKTI